MQDKSQHHRVEDRFKAAPEQYQPGQQKPLWPDIRFQSPHLYILVILPLAPNKCSMGLFHRVGSCTCPFLLSSPSSAPHVTLFICPLPSQLCSYADDHSQAAYMIWYIPFYYQLMLLVFVLLFPYLFFVSTVKHTDCCALVSSCTKHAGCCWLYYQFSSSVATQSASDTSIQFLAETCCAKCPRPRAESCLMTMKLWMSSAEVGSR